MITGKLAYKSLDGRVKGHIEIDGFDWADLVKAAEARVMKSSCTGCWALFGNDGKKIKAGKFSDGLWRIKAPKASRK